MQDIHGLTAQAQIHQAVVLGHYGRVVRLVRLASGLTQEQLGARIGYSGPTISRLERGRQALHDIGTMRLLARELHIPPRWLGLAEDTTQTADPPLSPFPPHGRDSVDPARAGEDETVKRRRFITGLTGLSGAAFLSTATESANALTMTGRLEQLLTTSTAGTAGAPVSVDQLAHSVAAAQDAFGTAQYGELSATLPGLITTAIATAGQATGTVGDQAHLLLTDAYLLAAELATKLNQDGMAWVMSDRALTAAHVCGDPIVIAAASRQVAIAMRRQGHHTGATDLLVRAALSLEVGTKTPVSPALSIYTALLCTAAYACAQNGRRPQAIELIEEAETAAAHLPQSRPGRAHTPTPANVAVYRIGIHTALGEPGLALDHARTINSRLLPSPERYARYCIDTARAWEAFGRPDRAVSALLAAERAAPQETCRPSVTTFISGMLYAPGPLPAELHALACRTGAS
ncbi:helix-turn-helix domain-containing protein [Streptosporangium sp. NPDC004631]